MRPGALAALGRQVERDSAQAPRRATVAPVVPLVSVVVLALAVGLLAPLRAEAQAAPSSNKGTAFDIELPKIGYATEDTYDPALLDDMRSVVDGLGGPDRTVFDFTNTPGFFWYLLGFDPTTSYFHVSMAVPEFAQEDLIDQLEEDPPALVAFDAVIGLPAWDYVANEIRHYEVSQYLLDGWTPVLSTHGMLFMLRNDLLADRPELPTTEEPSETDDLYFSSHSCDWGAVPDFLPAPERPATAVDVPPSRLARQVMLAGWAVDPTTGEVPTRLIVASRHSVVSTLLPAVPRPDVVEGLGPGTPLESGFNAQVLTQTSGPIRVYAEYADGRARVLPGRGRGDIEDSLEMPDGSVVPVVVGEQAVGQVDGLTTLHGRLSTVPVPPDLSLADVRAVTFETGGRPFGRSDYTLTDSLIGLADRDRSILFRTLPIAGDDVSVRVGACLQWHGYESDELYLFRRHGVDVRRVELVQ